jgi:hypothetical protein
MTPEARIRMQNLPGNYFKNFYTDFLPQVLCRYFTANAIAFQTVFEFSISLLIIVAGMVGK